MLNRNDFWSNCWHATKQPALTVDRPYCKAFQLAPANLNRINDLVFKIIVCSMNKESRDTIGNPEDHASILRWLSTTKVFFIDVVNQLDSFIQLENAILDSFTPMQFLKHVNAIQLPVDIRVVHPVPPPNYLEKRKAVDFLHTDAWRGEPPDVVNCVLYCIVSDKTSQLVVYDVDEGGIDKFEAYADDEKDAKHLIEDLPEIKFQHIPGEVVFFDAYEPHNTKRNGDDIRISLNFSFRRGDPYETLDERWDRDQQPWCKYWYLPQEPTEKFEVRSERELEKMVASGHSEAIKWRNAAIQKLMVPRRLEELYAG